MKKVYVKPTIIIEDFSLNTTIANTCEKKTNTPAQFACGIEMAPGLTIFTDTMNGICTTTEYNEDQFDGACYHLPEESNNMFNS